MGSQPHLPEEWKEYFSPLSLAALGDLLDVRECVCDGCIVLGRAGQLPKLSHLFVAWVAVLLWLGMPV